MHYVRFHRQNCDVQQTTHFLDVIYIRETRGTIFSTFHKYVE